MSNLDIVRAWKDENYRNSLSEAELAMLPANPAGMIELTNEELGDVAGGRVAAATQPVISFGCCDKTITVGSCKVGSLGCCAMQ